MIRRIMSWFLICAICAFVLGAAESLPPRLIVAVRDVTPSYCCLAAANQKLREVVAALGPGDRFVLIDLGSHFSPEKQVKVIATLPAIPVELLNDDRLSGMRQRMERISRLIATVEGGKKAILDYLARPVAIDRAGTDVLGVLRYTATLLTDDASEEKYALWFSDLVHELGAVRTRFPPPGPLPMTGARVELLFMPFGADWEPRKKAWTRFFLQSGASDVQVWDAGVSRARVPVPKRSLVLPAQASARR
jgi:hypothetical protein